MPFPPESPHLHRAEAAAAAAGLPLRGITLLAVEDSRFASDALRLICQQAGARLRRADCLAAARAHLVVYRPDVAIVDLGLPDGPGTDLIAELAGQGLPVVAISGNPDGRDAAVEAGAVAFLEKPLPSVGAFLRLIRQLVAGVGAEPALPGTDHPAGDPVALRDDLARAAALVAAGDQDPQYVAGFLRGIARTAGDPGLEAAALAAATAPGRAALSDLLAERLAALRFPG
jgi:CheY-like chemotaxis protein